MPEFLEEMTALVPVSQTEKWITTEPEYIPLNVWIPVVAPIRDITPVDNQKIDVVE